MLYISEYIIVQDLNNTEKLLYSTISTSMVILENSLYDEIFIRQDFNSHLETIKQLLDMGFLCREKNSQLKELERIRKEIVEADHGITAITIAPTMECNARCYYCFENGARKGTMTEDTAKQVVDFLAKYCTSKELYVSWFGGEPLMAPDIIDQITEGLISSNINVESTITTNGILIDKNMIFKMKKWNVQRVQITLDGLEEKYNVIKNYIYSFENPFERIMQNIEMLMDNDINVHLRVNYKSTDERTVIETMNYLHLRFGSYDKLYLYGAPLDLPKIKGYSEFDQKEGETFLKVLHMSLDNGYENDELNFRALRVSEDYNVALGEFMLAPFPAACYMVNRYRFVIDDQGILYKCQKHLGQPDFSCGDVRNGFIENNIFHYYSTEKLHDSSCEHCFMLPICQGGCNANRLLYGSKFACPPSKTIVQKLVKAYYDYLLKGGQE